MRIIVAIIVVMMMFTITGAEEIHKFAIGGHGGITTILGGEKPWFTVDKSYGIRLRSNLSEKWGLELGLSSFKIFDDSSAHTEFKIGSDEYSRLRIWKGYNLSLFFKYRFFKHPERFGIYAGFGGGFINWKINDAKVDTTYNAIGERGEFVDLAVSEVIASGLLGFEYRLHNKIMLGIDFQINHLTGFGQEFATEVEEKLSDWNLTAGLQVSYLFGHKHVGRPPQPKSWGSTDLLRPVSGMISPVVLQETRVAVEVGEDSDRDGIPDVSDDCPGTAPDARSMVDIRGCPVDSDCDGFPDYLDNCPYNELGAMVDISGCPIDSDNDNIPDGLDDCPGSDPELGVDESGCIDLTPLEKPVVLNIKYNSGSFEIDQKAKNVLTRLSRTLLKAPGVRIQINGYTDNIGVAEANKALSQKRANRVKDFLIRLGVAEARITASGRGETGFIASNATREDRQKNRRVELIFFK